MWMYGKQKKSVFVRVAVFVCRKPNGPDFWGKDNQNPALPENKMGQVAEYAIHWEHNSDCQRVAADPNAFVKSKKG